MTLQVVALYISLDLFCLIGIVGISKDFDNKESGICFSDMITLLIDNITLQFRNSHNPPSNGDITQLVNKSITLKTIYHNHYKYFKDVAMSLLDSN